MSDVEPEVVDDNWRSKSWRTWANEARKLSQQLTTREHEVSDLRHQFSAAQEKIFAHEAWLKADSQYAENQRLKVEFADSESIRHAEKEILIAEIAAHTVTRAGLAAARQEAAR